MTHKNKDQHLSIEQVAICSDALNDGTYFQLHEDIRHHLQECDSCAEEVLNVAEIVSETGEVNIPVELNKYISDKKSGRTIPIHRKIIITLTAAAAAIVIAIVIFSNQWLLQENENGVAGIQHENYEEQNKIADIDEPAYLKDKTEKDNKEVKEYETKEYVSDSESGSVNYSELASFEPDQTLEQLYENMQGTYRGRTIEVKTSPEADYKDGLKLHWKNPDGHTLYLELFNNTGEEIHSTTTSKENYEIPALQPGLYYWKLISEDFDLLFVGKIIRY